MRCVYDRPLDHVGPTPLYLVNPNHRVRMLRALCSHLLLSLPFVYIFSMKKNAPPFDRNNTFDVNFDQN